MAKQTPEGKVKKKLLDFLKSLGGDCFYYMPVQNGMGQTGIPDVMAIINGIPFAFECKATPKQQPTVLQAHALDRIHKARGYAWVVDDESVSLAIDFLKEFTQDPESMEYASYEDMEFISQHESFGCFYRWRKKLEPVEFDNGDLC